MTDNDIKIVLELLHKRILHSKIAEEVTEAEIMTLVEVVDLINRQKAEIESLKHRKTELQIRNQELQHEKSEAIKEFAEKLKNCFCVSKEYLDIMNIIDNLIKVMEDKNV